MRTIADICNDFDITQEDIEARKALNEYINSLSSVLVDEFYALYLKTNPKFTSYLEKTDGSLLLKKLKEFIVFVFTAPLNQVYLERIENIGFVHFSIQLPPARVSYAFWALHQILTKMSEVNSIVKDSFGVISKFLYMIEHVMNDSYYEREKKRYSENDSKHQMLGTFDELYSALYLHKKNFEKVQRHFNEGDEKLLKEISLEHTRCMMGKILYALEDKRDFLRHFKIDIDAISLLHVSWHQTFSKYVKADDVSLSEQELSKLESITKDMEALIDGPLHEYANESFLSLNSGIKAIRTMSELFYLKPTNAEDDGISVLSEAIQKNFISNFAWAIEEMVMEKEAILSRNYNLCHILKYSKQTLYVGIKMREGVNTSHLTEMLTLLLEVLQMNFSIQERERDLMAFADKAESANRSKDMFLANMSHELRTPLNAITGFSQILMMRPDTSDKVKTYVEKINIAGNNLLHLVNTILDFAKLESGKMTFNPRLCNIDGVFSEVKTLITPLAEKKEITITYPHVKSLNLLLDPDLFKQVLINLLSNAIKFTPNGGIVNFSMSYNKERREYLFSICDNGVGISKENQKLLFKAFSQVENVYQKQQQGTGLGLMISKKIVEELHNGRIWLESEEGVGSSFYVSLPIPSTESHTYIVSETISERSLLLVEDSEDYQRVIADHLKDIYTITVTDTINRAKELLVGNTYDFIILDYFLIDGISSEILQFMEDENIEITCIVVSAEDDVHIAESLKGFSNLQSILSKNDIDHICSLLKEKKGLL